MNVLIAKCLHCGKVNCQGTVRSTTRCKDCENLDSRYHAAASAFIKSGRPIPPKSLSDMMEEYSRRSLLGLSVPKEFRR